MRTEGLVEAEGVEIDAKRLHVDRPMGCRRHAVDREQPANRVNLLGDRSDIVEAADEVGAVTQGEEARPGSEQSIEAGGIEEAVLWVDVPFADDDASLG